MGRPVKWYPVGLVGEQHYQAAIERAAAGDAAAVLAEQGNPFDAAALAVVDADGATLGYVPRGHWLGRALLEEGKGCRAQVQSTGTGERAMLGIVIAVALTEGEAIGTRDYGRGD